MTLKNIETIELNAGNDLELFVVGALNSPWHLTGNFEVEREADDVTVVDVRIDELSANEYEPATWGGPITTLGSSWRESPALKNMLIKALQSAIDDGQISLP